MATKKQIEANRLNSQKSTGPRTAAGKARSSKNALKSGIDAKSLIIRGESHADFESLQAAYYAHFQPATLPERQYVDILIHADWRLRRLMRAEAELWQHKFATFDEWDEAPEVPLGRAFAETEAFTRLQRCMDSTERSYRRALQELQRLQSTRPPAPPPAPQPIDAPCPSPEIGFVPSFHSPAPLPLPLDTPDHMLRVIKSTPSGVLR